VPFILSNPESPLSRDVSKLAQTLIGGVAASDDDKPTNKRGIFARR
jgi:hypothetical protein